MWLNNAYGVLLSRIHINHGSMYQIRYILINKINKVKSNKKKIQHNIKILSIRKNYLQRTELYSLSFQLPKIEFVWVKYVIIDTLVLSIINGYMCCDRTQHENDLPTMLDHGVYQNRKGHKYTAWMFNHIFFIWYTTNIDTEWFECIIILLFNYIIVALSTLNIL